MPENAVGVDIGGTKVLAGVVDRAGVVLARARRETPHRSSAPGVVEDTIVEAVDELRATYDVGAVGVGAAGFVDRAGAVLFAPHLSWRDEPLQEVLMRRLALPVVVDNDANAAAHAETNFGVARGKRQLVCVTLGTGIGGAIVVDGRVMRGAHGLAGEFGHMQVVPDGRPCECGQVGCWEQYCSGKALARAVSEAHPGQPPVSGPDITRAAAAGEAWALAAFDEVGQLAGGRPRRAGLRLRPRGRGGGRGTLRRRRPVAGAGEVGAGCTHARPGPPAGRAAAPRAAGQRGRLHRGGRPGARVGRGRLRRRTGTLLDHVTHSAG